MSGATARPRAEASASVARADIRRDERALESPRLNGGLLSGAVPGRREGGIFALETHKSGGL